MASGSGQPVTRTCMDCGAALAPLKGRPSPRCKPCREKHQRAQTRARDRHRGRAGAMRWVEEVGDESDWEATWGAPHRVGLPAGVGSMYSIFHHNGASEMELM